jgi:hypothetical protein
MDLLHVDPAARPRGEEVLRRLAAPAAPEVTGPPRADPDAAARFVGRERELAALDEALASGRARAAAVFVAGESGVGKSALVRRFTERVLDERPGAVVLAGRCYEGEWVPFKALDGVVDALAAHLAGLPRGEAAALLPEHAGLLSQAFLVLERVEAIASAPAPRRDGVDLRDRRLLVFGALRALIGALAARAPLVIVIDDLQWADADSLALLRELLREPGAPAALFVITLRARAGEGPDPYALLGAPAGGLCELRLLALAPLPREQARALAEQLVDAPGGWGPGRAPEADAGALADESGGHPLFLQELVLHHRLRADAGGAGPFRLDEALWERARLLDPPALRLLSAVAIAGGRLTQAVAARAGDLTPEEYDHHVAGLRAASLVRTAGRRGSDTIEPYHDRVREAVSARIEGEDRRACHRRLALALEVLPDGRDDHEMLALHWQGAGERGRAAEHAVRAAARAEEALAFDRAARLYALAIELARAGGGQLGPEGGAAGASLRPRLGEALANAGRGAEAAATFLAAAREAGGGAALDLRRRAADQLLRSGHIDEALAVFRVVLQAVGVDMPDSTRGALAAFLLRRAQIRLRRLGFRERDEGGLSPEDLLRIDTCWSASAGLGLVDTILGQYFQARSLLLALDAGEPHRVQRALAMEAAYASAEGGRAAARTATLLSGARALGERLGKPYGLALTTMCEGVAATLVGRFRTAHAACERAEVDFRDRCTGVTWERATARWFSLWSLAYLGDLAELGRRIPLRLREAAERGDLYAAVCCSTGLAGLVWLAADDPEAALARSRDALARWSQRRFHVEHWWSMLGERQIDLYRGDAAAAHARLHERWGALRGSLLLRVQLTRIEATHLRARAALALARARPSDRRARAAEVEAGARRILAERMPWATPLAALLRAGVAATRGDAGRADALLREAARGLEAADMALYAAAARWQRGRILGGEAGRALVTAAEAWMGEQGVVATSRMAAMLAPGFDP